MRPESILASLPEAAIHIRPTAELAERVLLPGDPGRALLLAQALLEEPRMFNHHRGLWGYTGKAPDGEPLTIQSTGMGGPSAAIVVEELIALGARRLVRVGTCGALDGGLELGELVVAGEALAADGASRALGASGRVPADPELTAALAAAADEPCTSGTVVSSDLFYDPEPGRAEGWLEEGAVAVDMEAATVLQVSARHGCPAACLLAVSDIVLPERRRIDDQALKAAEERLGRVASRALAPR
jgi:DeoD family purine-nucleoside phosphorylase